MQAATIRSIVALEQVASSDEATKATRGTLLEAQPPRATEEPVPLPPALVATMRAKAQHLATSLEAQGNLHSPQPM